MKQNIVLLIAVVLLAVGCKRDNWIDWKVENQIWLQQNKLNHANDTAFHVTSSGLQYRIFADPNPTDTKPSNASTVTCDYEGKLINGMPFDGGTGNFVLGQTIAGFTEGLKKIHTHGDIELYIPYEIGYGAEGNGTEGTSSYIPPYSTLIFKIHLSAVK